MGDCLWYVAALCDNYDLKLEEIAEASIEKTRRRYDHNGVVQGRE